SAKSQLRGNRLDANAGFELCRVGRRDHLNQHDGRLMVGGDLDPELHGLAGLGGTVGGDQDLVHRRLLRLVRFIDDSATRSSGLFAPVASGRPPIIGAVKYGSKKAGAPMRLRAAGRTLGPWPATNSSSSTVVTSADGQASSSGMSTSSRAAGRSASRSR